MRSGLRVVALCGVAVCLISGARAGVAPVVPDSVSRAREIEHLWAPTEQNVPTVDLTIPLMSEAVREDRAPVPAAAERGSTALVEPTHHPVAGVQANNAPLPSTAWSGLGMLVILAAAGSTRTTRRWLV
jgi:hypothetical protein